MLRQRRRPISRLFVNSLERRIVPAAFELPAIGIPTANIQVIGPELAPESAFDRSGNALLGLKTRYTDELLGIYQAAQARPTGRLAEQFPLLAFGPDGRSVGVRITAHDINALLPSLRAIGPSIPSSNSAATNHRIAARASPSMTA